MCFLPLRYPCKKSRLLELPMSVMVVADSLLRVLPKRFEVSIRDLV